MRLRPFWARRLVGALLFALAPLPTVAGEPPSDAAILDAFARIAFGNEHMPEPDPRLQKWVAPIRWRAFEAVPLARAERAFLQTHMVRLGQLTGHDIKPAESWPEANFLVLLVAEDRYAATIDRHLAANRKHLLARLAGTACVGLLRSHRETHAIEFAVAIIPVERARARGLVHSCIAEETTQVLGLPNDVDLPGTLFNDQGEARDLTPLDRLLLHLLYRPALRPGMRRGEALAVARELLPMLRRTER